MKAFTSLVLQCAAAVSVAAVALPDGIQLATAPKEGYEVIPMQWEGVIKEGDAAVSLNGTIESVVAQIMELNPDFEMAEKEVVASASSGLEARSPTDIVCDFGGTGYSEVKAVRRENRYLRSLGNSVCGVNGGPGTCARVSCSHGDAIWLCNDNRHYISPKCSDLADSVDRIIARCKSSARPGPCVVKPCAPSWNADFVRGQQFDTEGFNVIIGRDSC